MSPHLQSCLRLTLIGTLLAALCCDPLGAQFDGGRGGRRGRGGPGGGPGGGFGGGGLSGTLRSEDVQQALGLSDEQRTALEELNSDEDGREVMREFRDRMRAAESDEERQALMAEAQQRAQERQQQREEQVKQILDERQVSRLNELSLQRAGPSALARDEIAESLGLDESQRTQLTALNDEYRAAMFELGFRASDEDRQRLREEYEAKFLGVLNNSQQSAWTAKLGEPAEFDLRGGGRRDGRDGAPNGEAQASAQPQPPVRRPVIVTPPPEGAESVSSFGAPAGEIEGREQEEAIFSFNFRYAPWVDVLRLFANRAGLTLDLNIVPPGTFNYFDDGSYTITEALDILNGYLLPKGYVLVRRNRFLVCVSIDEPIPPNLVPTVDKSELYQRGKNELMTVVFPVEGANIDDVVKEVGQLVGPQGKPVGLKSTNSIVVTDIGSNLRRIDQLLQQIAAAPDATVFKAYPLVNIPADEAELTVRALLGLQIGVTDVSAGNDPRFDSRDPRNFDRNRSQNNSRPIEASSGPPARLYAELRTNSLMVTATPAEQRIVEETLKVIDVDEDAAPYARGRRPYLQVYEVKSSDPREVVKTLAVLIPGVVVNEDGRNGKLHIVATEVQHQEVATLVRQLDGLGAGEQVAVIPLVKMDPVTASITLRSMFVRDGEDAPTIEPDLYGRQLMIRGTSAQLVQAQQILAQLGEDGTGQRRAGDGILSTFPLSGRDPAELLPLLERAWGNTAPNPVKIVRPKQRGPVDDVRTPGSSAPTDFGTEADGPSALFQPQQTPDMQFRSADDAQRRRFTLPLGGSSAARGGESAVATWNLLLARSPSPAALAADPPHREGEAAAAQRSPGVIPQFTQNERPQRKPDASRGVPVQFAVQTETRNDDNATTPADARPQPRLSDDELDALIDLIDTPAERPNPAAAPPASAAQNDNATPADAVPQSRTLGNPDAPITVTVLGDDLLISSPDPVVRAQMEELLEDLMQAVPPRTSWTIFPLEYADVTTTAATLEQLFPDSQVASVDSLSSGSMFSSLTSGISSMTDTLSSVSGLSGGATVGVRMIPYVPDNSLFVSGPSHKVQEIEQMLQILDSGELSASLRERTPRMIPVKYADIDEVYNIVKDVYKDLMENEQDRGARNAANMFATMMGGRRGGSEGQSSPASSLSLGIDRQTSQLVVSSSESRFQEIKTLVEQVDTAALEARRTVKVVTLYNTSTAQLTNTVSSLMPRVKLSSTSSRGGTSNGSSGGEASSSNDNGGSRPDPEAFRRMMEQRMRAPAAGRRRRRRTPRLRRRSTRIRRRTPRRRPSRRTLVTRPNPPLIPNPSRHGHRRPARPSRPRQRRRHALRQGGSERSPRRSDPR